jgi:uncharacterized membrane protein YfcA
MAWRSRGSPPTLPPGTAAPTNTPSMTIRIILLALLVASSLFFAARWVASARLERGDAAGPIEASHRPSVMQFAIGAVTNFFDTLGIGSFATTTSVYKFLRLVPDERIPGTMVVGHALPVVAQALIFIAIVQVDSTLLLSMLAVSLVGGWLGAGVVTQLPRRRIQVGMGTALLVAATFMVLSLTGFLPSGGTALGLPPGPFVLALVVNFILGALIMLGIGNYAPCLVLLSLLGMDPRAAFPIMMTTGAMVAMVGGLKFMTSLRYYDARAALGLTLGGIPAVLVAGLIVKSLPLEVLRWVVVVVVVYAALAMLRSARGEAPAAAASL